MSGIKFFFPKNPKLWKPPTSQYQQSTNITQASEDEIALIRSARARNLIEARLLMERFPGLRGWEIVKRLPRVRPTIWQRFKRQCVILIMRLEGSSEHGVSNPRKIEKHHQRLTVRTKYKKD